MTGINWTLSSVTYSGEKDGFRFTYGSAGTLVNWRWSAREGNSEKDQRGWVGSETAAQHACANAMAEMLKRKKGGRAA